MNKDERNNGLVGDIRIKEPKKKKERKKKKSSTSETSLGVKIFVWFMFIAMAASFFVPLIYRFISLLAG